MENLNAASEKKLSLLGNLCTAELVEAMIRLFNIFQDSLYESGVSALVCPVVLVRDVNNGHYCGVPVRRSKLWPL
jgi:hypothetical protein